MNLLKRNKIEAILKDDIMVFSPVAKGISKKLKSLRDGVFSLHGLGDGITIDVQDDMVDIFSPVDGEVQVVYPHGNCYGLIAKNNSKILIHIGTEHSHLKNEYSKAFVKQGDKILKGQKLATINMKYMKDNTTITSVEEIIVVVTSGDEVLNKHKGKLDKTTNIFITRKK